MISDNKEWLKLATSSFRDSTTYYESELFAQWEDNIKMFGNEHPSGSKYNSELYSKRSKVFRPKTRSSCMSFEAAVCTAYFANADLVDIQPQNQANQMQVLSSKVHDNLLQYRLSNTVPWFRIVCGAAQEVWKMGSVLSHQYWNFVEDKDGNAVKDSLACSLVPLENLRIHPSADWLDPIGTSPYIVILDPKFVYQIKEGVDTGKYLKTIEDGDIIAAKASEADPLRLARNKNVDPLTTKSGVQDFDTVFIHKNIVNKDGEDWYYETLGLTKLLSKPVLLSEKYPTGRPYVFGSALSEPHKVFNQGMPEMGQPIQEEMNNIANDRLDNVKLVLNKRYFAKRGRNVDFRSLLRNIPGSITMMDNPMEDVQVVPTVDITSSSYSEQDRLNADYDELLGNFSTGSAGTNKSGGKGADTVGGMGMMASGAGQVTEYLIRIFNETWVEPVLKQFIALEKHYESPEIVMQMSADMEEAQAFLADNEQGVEKLLNQDLLVNVNVGISATNPQFKLEKLLFGINSMTQILANPASKYMDLKELGSEVFGALGYRDGSRFFPAFKKGIDPQIQELEEQVQQLTAQLEGKQAEIQAKQQVDMAKVQVSAEKVKIDQQKVQIVAQEAQADIEKTIAEIKKIEAEIQEMVGQDNALEVEKLKLDALKLMNDKEKFLTENKTKRDDIMAKWKQKSEELDAKLKITLINSRGGGGASPGTGGGVSKDTLSQKKLSTTKDKTKGKAA